MQHKELIIATDLDGTFLEGTDEEKNKFYRYLNQSRDKIGIVFVTGRTLDLVKSLYDQGLEFIPDYIIADHGTIVVNGDDFQYVEDIQSQIISRWQEADHQSLKVLLQSQAVQEQPFDPPYRHAYYYQKESFDISTVDDIKSLGFECILSHDVYLDILPAGITKGATLKRLIAYLECDSDNVITCGDSLNDLPLFETGYKSIAVSNSEPALLGKIKDMKNVIISQYPGVSGIVDGINKHIY